MRKFSEDLRSRIVATVSEGLSQKQVAKMFRVSYITVHRYVNRQKYPEKYPVQPPRYGQKRLKISAEHVENLRQLCLDHPDWTNQQRRDFWEETYHVSMCESAMRRSVLRLGMTVKKNNTGSRKGSA